MQNLINNSNQGVMAMGKKKIVISGSDINDLTIVRAINILGAKRVVTVAQSSQAWNVQTPQDKAIRYFEADLRQCAAENRSRKANWYLVYCHGLNLHKQRKIVGVNTDKQPCFYNNDWWRKRKEDEWSKFNPPADYYLLDFQGRFADRNWQEQEAEIAKMSGMERAHETIVSEADIAVYKTHNFRLLVHWHWGKSLDSNGFRVFIADFGVIGMYIDRGWSEYSGNSDLRVVLLRKFENLEN